MSSSGIDRAFERRLASLVNAREPRVLQGGLKGVEKESLRVSPDGHIEQSAASARARLGAHARAHHHRLFRSADRAGHAARSASRGSCCSTCATCISSSIAISASSCCGRPACRASSTAMPSIPIARYGRSNIGRMKEVYRRGLGYRYGRMMQAISGVHYNYSFPAHFWPVLADDAAGSRSADQDFISAQYFGAAAQLSPLRLARFCICSAIRRRCAARSCADASTRCSSSLPARCTSRTRLRCA